MYKKVLKTLVLSLILFCICVSKSKAWQCLPEMNPEVENEKFTNTNVHGSLDWFNATLHWTSSDKDETADEKKKRQQEIINSLTLICGYSSYNNTSDHIEIYKYDDAGGMGIQYFAFNVTGSGTSQKYTALYCYNEKYTSQDTNVTDLPTNYMSDEEYEEFVNCGGGCEGPHYYNEGQQIKAGKNLGGSGSSDVFSRLTANQCPTFAGVADLTIDGYYLTKTLAVQEGDADTYPDVEGLKIGTCETVAQGFDCSTGFNKEGKPIEVKPKNVIVPGKPIDDSKHYVKHTERYEKNICNMVSTLKFLRIVRIFIIIARVMVPLVLIIMLTIDIYKCMIVDEGDFGKIRKKVITRVGIAIAVFFVPTIINALVNLAPNREEEPFYNCKVCFFGDDNNSLNTCEKIISTNSNEKYESDYDVDGLEDRCSDSTQNGFSDDLKSACGEPSIEASYTKCTSDFIGSHDVKTYYNECRCSDKYFNGYNKDLFAQCGNPEYTNSTAFSECQKNYKKTVDEFKKKCLEDNS